MSCDFVIPLSTRIDAISAFLAPSMSVSKRSPIIAMCDFGILSLSIAMSNINVLGLPMHIAAFPVAASSAAMVAPLPGLPSLTTIRVPIGMRVLLMT